MSRDEDFSEALHSLQAPLTILSTRLAAALEAKDEETRTRLLRECAQEVDGMSRVVTDLLLLAKLDAGAVPLGDEPIDLALVAREALESFRPAAEAKGLAVQFRERGPVPFRGDPHALRRLLLALLDNAAKYTPRGGLIAIEVDAYGITVCDTGVGIPRESLPRVFDRFYQASPEQGRELGGVGLGLAIAKSIAEQHRGTLSIESSPGRGTRVRFIVGRPFGLK